MSNHQKNSIRANLNIEPLEVQIKNASPNWFTLGDLHGNALKLLHFLIHHGAATMGEEGDYARFVEIYNKPIENLKQKDIEILTKNDIESLEKIINAISITSIAHIRLLGDDLCDRGSNDYFTLLLLQKLINGTETSGKVEILLSNHSEGFIHCHENNMGYDRGPLAHPLVPDQNASAKNLQSILNKGWVKKTQVNALYDNYKSKLKAMSYEVNDQGEISTIYTHAPMGEVDIFNMGLAIEKYAVAGDTSYLFTDDHRERITAILKDIRARNNKKGIASKHLASLMDLINDIVAHNAAQNHLSDLTKIGPDITDDQNINAKIHPFYMLLWNRAPRHDAKINNKRNCPIVYVHGHDKGEHNKNESRHSLDGPLGKGPGWHKGPLESIETNSILYPLAEPTDEIPEDPHSRISALSVPALLIPMTAAVALEEPISLIPYTEGAALDIFLLPYLTGKMAYWLNYGLLHLRDGEDADPEAIAKDSANLQWQLTFAMGGMEAAKHLSELIIFALQSTGVDVQQNFFETSLSFTTKIIEICPVEMKGALMLVSGFGFAIGATLAKWHQSHEQLEGMALAAELALTFCFGFIVGAAAAIGYKNEVAQFLMPAATTAVLMMGVHREWISPTPEQVVTPVIQRNDGQQSSTR